MDIQTAKEQVIEAGKRLVEQGLISRTWGNVSCRIDEKSFVITPSGKPYETLTPEQIVLVAVEKLAYDGDIKPSSEKGVHAEVYKARPEINFVIHTHQINASILGAVCCNLRYIPPVAAKVIGKNVPLAAYGLPGTKKLMEGVADVLARSKSNAILMAHHGVLCFGPDSETAFDCALLLEKVCAENVFLRFMKEYGTEVTDMALFVEKMAEKAIGVKDFALLEKPGYTSIRKGENFVLSIADGSEKPVVINTASGKSVNEGKLPAVAALHRAVYLKRPDMNFIVHTRSGESLAVSCLGQTVKPLLDDFAQIVGVDIRCAAFDEKNAEKSALQCVNALKGRHAVLIKNDGALSCGSSESDARAVEMINDKNSLVFLGTMLYNVYQPITPVHSQLMRFIYLKKYSKQAK